MTLFISFDTILVYKSLLVCYWLNYKPQDHLNVKSVSLYHCCCYCSRYTVMLCSERLFRFHFTVLNLTPENELFLQSKCSTAEAFCRYDSHSHLCWGIGIVWSHCWHHPLFPCWPIQSWVISILSLLVGHIATDSCIVNFIRDLGRVRVELCHVLLSSYVVIIKLTLLWNKAYQTISLALLYLLMLSQTRLVIFVRNILFVFWFQ